MLITVTTLDGEHVTYTSDRDPQYGTGIHEGALLIRGGQEEMIGMHASGMWSHVVITNRKPLQITQKED